MLVGLGAADYSPLAGRTRREPFERGDPAPIYGLRPNTVRAKSDGHVGIDLEERYCIDRQQICHPLDGFEREISLAALEAAHIGAVQTEEVSQVLLAEAAGFAVPADVAPEDPLQLAFHTFEARKVLLGGLQTYE
jgi:hypothetical protein